MYEVGRSPDIKSIPDSIKSKLLTIVAKSVEEHNRGKNNDGYDDLISYIDTTYPDNVTFEKKFGFSKYNYLVSFLVDHYEPNITPNEQQIRVVYKLNKQLIDQKMSAENHALPITNTEHLPEGVAAVNITGIHGDPLSED